MSTLTLFLFKNVPILNMRTTRSQKQARKGFRPISAIRIFRYFVSNFWGSFWEFFGNFGKNSLVIPSELFGNSLEMLWEFFGNPLGTLWELFGNSLGILMKVYWNSFGILLGGF